LAALARPRPETSSGIGPSIAVRRHEGASRRQALSRVGPESASACQGGSWRGKLGGTLLGGPYHLTGVAPAGPVVRAGAAIGLAVEGVPAVLALDADRDEFVHVPGLPGGTGNKVVLSDDGRRLLLIAPHGTPRNPILPKPAGLCVHDLASGRQRWYPGDVDGRDVAAALSPDGAVIASLCTPWDPDDDSDDSGLAAIGLTDTTTGQRRRLWATRGGHSSQSTISWSPAGRYIAVTYLVYVADREDVYCQTSVADLAGNAWTQ
jgi:hypothetical protein